MPRTVGAFTTFTRQCPGVRGQNVDRASRATGVWSRAWSGLLARTRKNASADCRHRLNTSLATPIAVTALGQPA